LSLFLLLVTNIMVAMKADTLDIWLASLDLGVDQVAELAQVLTAAELAGCDRCRLPDVRRRKVVARARLRQVLANYLQCSPAEIQIEVGAQGKPQVAGLEFNLSHSDDLAGYVVADQPVGIDLEKVRSLDVAGIVERFFAPSEWQVWQSLPVDQQQLAFFRAWTVKEAYLKAIGTGLYTPLSEVVVEINPVRPLAILSHPEWQVQGLDLPVGYVGAVVAKEIGQVNYREQSVGAFG
jgi:4'-phosphopantetheinyl transferase